MTYIFSVTEWHNGSQILTNYFMGFESIAKYLIETNDGEVFKTTWDGAEEERRICETQLAFCFWRCRCSGIGLMIKTHMGFGIEREYTIEAVPVREE